MSNQTYDEANLPEEEGIYLKPGDEVKVVNPGGLPRELPLNPEQKNRETLKNNRKLCEKTQSGQSSGCKFNIRDSKPSCDIDESKTAELYKKYKMSDKDKKISHKFDCERKKNKFTEMLPIDGSDYVYMTNNISRKEETFYSPFEKNRAQSTYQLNTSRNHPNKVYEAPAQSAVPGEIELPKGPQGTVRKNPKPPEQTTAQTGRVRELVNEIERNQKPTARETLVGKKRRTMKKNKNKKSVKKNKNKRKATMKKDLRKKRKSNKKK